MDETHDDGAINLCSDEIKKFEPEARQRLAPLANFGIEISPRISSNECRRVAIVRKARRLLESTSSEPFSIPTTSEKPTDYSENSYILELYRRFFGEYPDIGRMTEEEIERLWEWCDLLSTSGIKDEIFSPMPKDYSAEASIHEAVRGELANIIDRIASSGNEEEAIEGMKRILSIVSKIKPEQMRYYRYLGEHFGKFIKHARNQRWENIFSLVYANEEKLFEVIRNKSRINEDLETEYAVFMGLSNEDKTRIRQENWNNLNLWLTQRATNKSPITISDIEEIHRQATKGILPGFTQGIRKEAGVYCSCRLHRAPEVEVMQRELESMIQKANELCAFKGPSALFFVKLATIAVEYARIHPHFDGNGTAGLVFCELIARMRGMEPADITSPSYAQRIRNIFRNNRVALAYLAVKEQEILYQEGSIKSLGRVFRNQPWKYQ